MKRWSLPAWRGGIGVSAETRRYAALSGSRGANETTLGKLREFVASLERWPDRALVTSENGSVVQIEFFAAADPLTSEAVDSGPEVDHG